MKALFTLLLSLLLQAQFVFATEGMWIPTLLGSIEDDMQAFGLQLSAEDIYAVNSSSMKDAIAQFGGGCTAEVISENGLLLTNHHCGYRQIQSHSSLENNYLKDGFWAENYAAELANPGLTAMFVVSMEDVTGNMFKGITASTSMEDRRRILAENEKALLDAKLSELPGLEGFIRAFNYGNSYFMIITRTFRDIRLVGAPPSSIGKFGGDTDNWVWPRHTGDFSLFRIYADADNLPADYQESNKPYKPNYHLPVSLDGVEEGDFTMVFGFPGRTEQFLTVEAVDYIINQANPMRIEMRETSLGIIDAAMRAEESVYIKYAAKQSSISNAYKKWVGQNIGLIELDALGKKKELEGSYRTLSMVRKNKEYVDNIDRLDALNKEMRNYRMGRDVFIEYYFYGPEIFRFANGFSDLVLNYEELAAAGKLEETLGRLKASREGFFKDYVQSIDEDVFVALTELYMKHMPADLIPDGFRSAFAKSKSDATLLKTALFGKSIFVSDEKLLKLLENPSKKGWMKLEKDPIFTLAQAMMNGYSELIRPSYNRLDDEINKAMALYVKGLQETFPDRSYWFDANSTLRLTYGKVEGSAPYDGMEYKFYSTGEGILQKAITGKADFEISERQAALLGAKLYGPYAHDDGSLRICFTGSNHTTGGNSGSPAINGEGELVGLNFDRSWESTMSDVLYDANRCRNIMVDVRYILWVIDIYAGAGHLVEEMTLVSSKGRDELAPMPVPKKK